MNNTEKNSESALWVLLFDRIRRRLPVILAVTLVFALLGALVSAFLIAPTYRANAELIVNAGERATQNITSEQLNTAESLAEIYSIIIKSDTVLERVAKETGSEERYEALAEKVLVDSVNGTAVIRVSVLDGDPEQAMQLLKGIVKIAPNVIQDKVEAGSVKIISEPRLQARPVSPSIPRNTVLCALIGLLLSTAIVLLRAVRNDTVNGKEQLESRVKVSVLGEIPAVEGKGAKSALLTEESSFFYKEAFRYLQTNVNLLAASNDLKAIVVTSAISGEGKTMVSINLSRALLSAGKRVVLVECDLRIPRVSAYLGLKQNRTQNGVRGLLSGACVLKDAILDADGLSVIPSGGTSDSSVELLGSKRMRTLIELLKTQYDYIILDAPPAGELADAIALSLGADAILLVARENYAGMKLIQSTAEQVRKTGVPVLGAVLNCSEPESARMRKNRYGKYSYYGKADSYRKAAGERRASRYRKTDREKRQS